MAPRVCLVAELGTLLLLRSILLRTQLKRAIKRLVFAHRKKPSYNGHNRKINGACATPAEHIRPKKPRIYRRSSRPCARMQPRSTLVTGAVRLDLIDMVFLHWANMTLWTPSCTRVMGSRKNSNLDSVSVHFLPYGLSAFSFGNLYLPTTCGWWSHRGTSKAPIRYGLEWRCAWTLYFTARNRE